MVICWWWWWWCLPAVDGDEKVGEWEEPWYRLRRLPEYLEEAEQEQFSTDNSLGLKWKFCKNWRRFCLNCFFPVITETVTWGWSWVSGRGGRWRRWRGRFLPTSPRNMMQLHIFSCCHPHDSCCQNKNEIATSLLRSCSSELRWPTCRTLIVFLVNNQHSHDLQSFITLLRYIVINHQCLTPHYLHEQPTWSIQCYHPVSILLLSSHSPPSSKYHQSCLFHHHRHHNYRDKPLIDGGIEVEQGSEGQDRVEEKV